MKKIILVMLCMMSVLTLVSAATTEQVSFNGEWANGTTLYSQNYPAKDYTIFGKDVYALEKPKQVCTTTQACSKYNYHFLTYCQVYDNRGRCRLYMRSTILDDCKTWKTVKNCQKTMPVMCESPNGFTNKLSLVYFKYSTDSGTTWNTIPYTSQGLKISGTVMFKLDIPESCSPKYDYDHAIKIRF